MNIQSIKIALKYDKFFCPMVASPFIALILGVVIPLCNGCNKEPSEKTLEPDYLNYASSATNRFIITRVQVIRDDLGYNNQRGIYIIKDNVTQTEYVGISGVGISAITPCGKVVLEQ